MNVPRWLDTATVLLALGAFGCATALPDKQPLPAQPISVGADEWRVTDQVVVITDGSGTMYVNETFPEAKALTRSFVAAMPAANVPARSSGYEAALIGFGGDDRTTRPLGPFDRSSLSSTAAELHVMGDVNGMGGETPLHDVLNEVRKDLSGKSGRTAVVLFSDGLPDAPELALAQAGALVKEHGGNVCFHAVQTGSDPEGTAFLRQLSGLTPCGTLRDASRVASGADVQQLARAVFVGPRSLPAVAAAGPCEGVVRLRGIRFGFDQAQITDDSKPVLDVAVEHLRRCPDIRVRIAGYTDSTGPEAYNEGLSERRAKATRAYFERSGIDAGRLETVGYGEADPVAPNDTPANRARNRRVELAPR